MAKDLGNMRPEKTVTKPKHVLQVSESYIEWFCSENGQTEQGESSRQIFLSIFIIELSILSLEHQ